MSDAIRAIPEAQDNSAGKLPPNLAAQLWSNIGDVPPTPMHILDAATKKQEMQSRELDQLKPLHEHFHNKGLPTERAHLTELLNRNFGKDEQGPLRDQLRQFEVRAWASSISKSEIAQTYSEISRILGQGSAVAVSPELRKQISRETIQHCANPEIISQGSHNTCNVTAIEVRTYSLHPAKAARLIADVATTGEYTSSGGIKVKLDHKSMRPDKEALDSLPQIGERDYATQLFNLAAVNIWYSAVRPGTQYEQRVRTEGGKEVVEERLTDYSSRKAVPVLEPGTHKPVSDPYLSANEIAFISDAIVGRHEPFAVLAVGDMSMHLPGSKNQATHAAEVFDESSLQRTLQKLKEKHQLPAIAAVDTSVDPLNVDSGAGIYGPGGGHVINVTDFQAGKSPRVSLDNEWSLREDHPDSSVDMHDLYLCMGGSDAARLDAYANVEEARAKGKSAPREELTKIRFDGQHGFLDNYAKDATDTIKHLAGSEQHLKAEERTRWLQALATIVNTVSSRDKVSLLKTVRSEGICSDSELGKLLAGASKSISFNKSNAIADGNDIEKRNCIKSTMEAVEFLCTLSTEAKKHYFAELRRE